MAVTYAPPGEPHTKWTVSRLWRREFEHYPSVRPRMVSLSIVVLTTVLFYYQYYVISGVSDQVIAETGMSFLFFVNINVVSALASGLTAIAAGWSDRFGRANIVTVGTLLCALVCLLGFPNAHTAWSVGILYTVLGAIEGVVLVATPALVRDFSPQLGRASAMGFWTIGPVVGSLLVSIIVTNTIEHLTAWQDQYIIAGIAGLFVFLIALFWLRELAPGLRDQIMVSEHDRVLIEARAKGIDVEAALKKPFRQMMHLDVLGSAVAISLLLFIYYAAVGFFPLFFQTTFGYSTSKANSLGNWMWGVQTVALIAVGWASDRLRVRKPFMLVGAIAAIASTLALINRTGHPETSYTTFAVILVCLAISLGLTFTPWMASFTETVERRNPALTATGLSLWGLILRTVVTISTFILPFVVHSVTTLVNEGPTVQAAVAGQDPTLSATQNATVKAVAADPTIVTKVQSLALKYKAELATAAKLTPATQDALSAHPNDQATQAAAVSEISGKPKAIAARVISLAAQYGPEIDTANAIDSATQVAVLGDPNDQQASAKAVTEIATGLKVTPEQAQERLQALKKVPVADLLFLSANADPIEKAGDQLTALAAVPAADLAYLSKYGTPLQDPKTQAALRYLEAHGPKVQAAAKAAPGEWQNYFWIGVAGQIIFIPFLWVMAGYWRPRRARQAEMQHEAVVDAELAKLGLPNLERT